jgi:hypothetical protein
MRIRSWHLQLCVPALFGLVTPATAQHVRQVSLNTATGEIDRSFLPSNQTFDFLIRAAAELREFRGQYRSGTATNVLPTWIRKEGTKSADATIRIDSLEPGRSYQFTFVLVRRPTGNEARLIEAGVLDALRDAFRRAPDQSLDSIVALAAPQVKAALEQVLQRGVPRAASALSGDRQALQAALGVRGVDVLHTDYVAQLVLVQALRVELRAARRAMAQQPQLARVTRTISETLGHRGSLAELGVPVAACRKVRDTSTFERPDTILTDLQQLTLLGALKELDAAIALCQGLLRDVRLPRYSAAFPGHLTVGRGGASQAADLLLPVSDRLEALRSATEGLVTLWRKREGSLGPVATDVRRALDTQVTVSDTLNASFATAAEPQVPPSATLGIALLATYAPCSTDSSCIRIVPAVSLGLRLSGILGAEAGFTLADTEAPGETQHLFWFTSAIAGLSVRLGKDRRQRVGAGVLILREADASEFDSFRLGGYASLTLYDFRL